MTLYVIAEKRYEDDPTTLGEACSIYEADSPGDLEEKMATEWDDTNEVVVYELSRVGTFLSSTIWTQTS